MIASSPPKPAHPIRATLLVIGAALALRLALGLAVGLGTDESYTVAIARQFSWSYFDHPPLHQWITHAAAALLGEGRLARLPFIALFAITSWLIFLITRRLYGAQAGFWAVVTLNLSGFFTISAGSWIVPDGALLFGLALAGFGASRALLPATGEAPAPWTGWLLAGLGFGLAGLAKYQAALAGLGLIGFLVATPEGRRALRHPAPWIAGLLGLVLVSPVLIWNAQHGWVSLGFQAARSQGGGFTPWLVPLSLLAQAGWLLPWVFVPLLRGALMVWRTLRDRRFWFLFALSVPAIALFSLTPAFGNLGLPHWAMPGWFFLMPLAGVALAEASRASETAARWARISAAGSAIVLALLAAQAATGWLGRLSPAIQRNDPTAELVEWRGLAAELARQGLSVPAGGFVVADAWHSAGRIDLALAGSVPVLPGTADARHFAFIVDQRGLIGRDALVIVRARREAQMRESLASHFASLGASVPVTLGRAGLPEIQLVAIPAQRFDRPFPWPYGRQP